MSRRAAIRRSDIESAAKAALALGLTISRIIARPDGVEIVTSDGTPHEPKASGDELDAEFADWKARHGQD